MSRNIEQVATRLQAIASSHNIVVQVVEKNSQIYVLLNRPPQTPPNCPELLPIIESTLKREFPAVETVNVFSREFGKANPDWRTVLRLQPETPINEQIDVGVDPGIQEPEQLREDAMATQESQQQAVTVSDAIPLSNFCFSRNRKILESDLDCPSKEVSAIIINFHKWGKEQQIKLLQFLKKWFNGEDDSLSGLADLSSEAQEIIESMQADKELQRSLRIWFSRYCYDPQKTIREISGDSPIEKQAPRKEGTAKPKTTRSQDASSREIHPSRIRQSTEASRLSSHATANQPTKTSTNPIGEIIQVLITALIASGLAFLVRDITMSVGIMGIVLFVVSTVSGFLSGFRKAIPSFIFFILEIIIVYAISRWSAIVIVVIANLVGGIVALSVFAITLNDGRLVTGKSLRIMTASLIAVMLSLWSATWFKVSPGVTDTSTFRVSGTVVLPEKTFNVNGGAIAVLGKSSVISRSLSIAALSEPISDEQLDYLKATFDRSVSGQSLCDVFYRAYYGKDSGLLFCLTVLIDLTNNRTPNVYDLSVIESASGKLIGERTVLGSAGMLIDSIDLKENGQVSFSLKTSIFNRLGADVPPSDTNSVGEVDVKFNTRIVSTYTD